jgi:hypothetical protein
VTQDCCFPAREQCCLLDCKWWWDAVSNQIDAAVNLMEAAALESKLDLSSRHAFLKKLPPGDNPMLPCRERRDDAVRTPREGFTTHNVVNPTLDLGAPSADAFGAPAL